mmetsp:Transcript_122180/g.228183  ORF Transcript_122180/g.228183 Transcript_122180/m.228183 type:complete len:144 (-) Transcript_122180:50-481(-)
MSHFKQKAVRKAPLLRVQPLHLPLAVDQLLVKALAAARSPPAAKSLPAASTLLEMHCSKSPRQVWKKAFLWYFWRSSSQSWHCACATQSRSAGCDARALSQTSQEQRLLDTARSRTQKQRHWRWQICDNPTGQDEWKPALDFR